MTTRRDRGPSAAPENDDATWPRPRLEPGREALDVTSSASRPGSKRGRGQVASSFSGAALGPRSRRVVIKLRLVVINAAGPRSVQMHLRYIVRDGVSRDGE